MGYRHRFAEVSKTIVNTVQDMSLEQLKEYLLTHNPKGYDTQEDYLCIYDLLGQKEIFDFGKDCFFAPDLIKQCEPVFTDNAIEVALDDTFVKVSREGFLFVIESFRQLIYNNFKEHFEANADIQKAYFASKMSEWGNKSDELGLTLDDEAKNRLNESLRPYSTDVTTDTIVRSWLYEYEIFELVRLYKTFDWENNVLLFYGW